MDLKQWVHDTIERWATYDGCPCSKARRSHAEFMADQLSSEKTPDITESLDGLRPTKSGADFEYQAVAVLGIIKRMAERMQDSIFDLIPKIDRLLQPPAVQAEWSDRDERYYQFVLSQKAQGETYLVLIDEESDSVDRVLNRLSRRRSVAMAGSEAILALTNALGSSTIEIVKKVELLDREKFDKWLGDVKEAVSVLYKEDKTTDDILSASTRLVELLDTESTKAFLRMLDSGLFDSIADKVDKVEKGIVDEPEKAAADEPVKAAVDEQKKSDVAYTSFGGFAHYTGRPQPLAEAVLSTVPKRAWQNWPDKTVAALGLEKQA